MPVSRSRLPSSNRSDNTEWLSLRDAAQLMGVHPATLRAWADRGRIASQRTAGGHRRFDRSEVAAWLDARRSNDAGAQVLVQTALGRLRIELEGASAPWLGRPDEVIQAAYRELGRRLMQEIVRAVSVSEMTEAVQAAATSLGREYAALSQRRGLSLIEAVRAFLFFRDNIVDSLVQMASALEPIAAPSWLAVHHQLSVFLNEVLLALVRVYEEARGTGTR